MKIIFTILVFSLYVSNAFVFAENTSHVESVMTPLKENVISLQADLKQDDLQSRTMAIRKLGVSSDPKAKDILLERYMQMPKEEARATATTQREKAELLSALLPKFEKTERAKFLMLVLKDEVYALKTAKIFGFDRHYPKHLLNRALGFVEEQDLSAESLALLSAWSSSYFLPQTTKAKFLSIVIRYDLNRTGNATPQEKIEYIINHIPVCPTAPMPWEYYTNTQKRVEYGHSDGYMRASAKCRKWLESDDSVRAAAYEEVLESNGILAVERIVMVLGDKSIAKERRDYLAVKATSVLMKCDVTSQHRLYASTNIVDALEKYVDEMDDMGAFCNRNKAIRQLHVFFNKSGFAKRYPLREGGSVCETLNAMMAAGPPPSNLVVKVPAARFVSGGVTFCYGLAVIGVVVLFIVLATRS